jgi:hypothetical protein
MAVTILLAISPGPSPGGDTSLSRGATSGLETIAPLGLLCNIESASSRQTESFTDGHPSGRSWLDHSGGHRRRGCCPTDLLREPHSVCLITMLGCSAAYNLAANAPRREFLRQLDHAAIFCSDPVPVCGATRPRKYFHRRRCRFLAALGYQM